MKAPAVVDSFPLMKWKGLRFTFPSRNCVKCLCTE